MTDTQKQLILAWFGYLPISGIDGIWGPQSIEATRNLQRKLGLNEDGIFGRETLQKALAAMEKGGIEEHIRRQTSDWWKEIVYFTPEEFACKCGRYCDGYPHEIHPLLVKIADRARTHFGHPITIVSGLRCRQHNANVGGVESSQHMYGEAADIHVWDTDPEVVLRWFTNQVDVRYAYRIEGSDNIHFDIAKGAR